MLTSSKCVLVLSDEGLNVYDSGSGRTSLVESVPWDADGFEVTVSQIIRRRSKGRPVMLFNDMVEQHYRKERIPKIGMLDRASVVERRLAAAFPSYPIRAALKLKDKGVSKPGEGAGDIHLFAAVPLSDNIRKTLTALTRAHSSISAFGLLPIESASLVQTLSKKLSKGLGRPAIWSIFVGQHQSGSLRQVVTRNGELALTRMTPITDDDQDPDTWAEEVVSEIKGTMSYLTRFGFDSNDGLDIIVIAGNNASEPISAKIDFECNLNVLTAPAAAKILGLNLGAQVDQRYADPLHVSWFSKKRILTLPLKSAALSDISRPAQFANYAMLLLAGTALYFAFTAWQSMSVWQKNTDRLNSAQSLLNQTRSEHETELADKKAAGIDYALIDKVTKAYHAVDAGAMKPLLFIDTLGRALGSDIALQSLSIEPTAITAPPGDAYVDPNLPPDFSQTTPSEAVEFAVALRVLFPDGTDPTLGVSEVNKLFARMQKALPDYKMDIVKQVADLSYTGNFVGESSSAGTVSPADRKLEAEIMIWGAMQ